MECIIDTIFELMVEIWLELMFLINFKQKKIITNKNRGIKYENYKTWYFRIGSWRWIR